MQTGNGSGLGAGVGGVEVGVHRWLTHCVGGQLKGPHSIKGAFSSPAWAGHGPQRPGQVWPLLMPPGKGPQGNNTPLQAQAVGHSAESLVSHDFAHHSSPPPSGSEKPCQRVLAMALVRILARREGIDLDMCEPLFIVGSLRYLLSLFVCFFV